ncbi:MAG: hypothetical protein M1814_002931 [Vezdaea aestivalis]|nr:MAG: hypothetical protein M1814_002931 [Vezdaea aestivalis]
MAFPKFGKAAHTNGAGTETTAPSTTTSTTPGLPSWLIFVRVFQILLVAIILGLSAYEIDVFRDAGCSSPGRVNFNIAAAVIALVLLVFQIFAISLSRKTPAIIFAQIPIDFVMFIFFIVAAAIAKYTYLDLYYNCYDSYDIFDKRSLTSRAPKGSRGGSRSGGGGGSDNATTTTARQGLDAFLGLTFLATLALTVFFAFKGGMKGLNFGKSKTTTNSAPMTGMAGSAEPNSYQYPPQQHSQTTGGTDPNYGQHAPQQYPMSTGGTYNQGAPQQFPMSTGGTYPQTQQSISPQPTPAPTAELPHQGGHVGTKAELPTQGGQVPPKAQEMA